MKTPQRKPPETVKELNRELKNYFEKLTKWLEVANAEINEAREKLGLPIRQQDPPPKPPVLE